jgi:16S rRNA processing protein RimM
VAEATEYITVGRLGKTRGVHGELYVTPLTDFPDRFLGLEELWVDNRGTWEKLRLDSSRMISGRPVIRFSQIDTPEAASLLTNRHVAVTREQLVALPEGSYYIFDLVGCQVFADGTEKLLGEVIDVRQYPANDAYLIRRPDGTDVLFPAVRQFVKMIDVAAKKIVVDPAGLFDEEKKPVDQ